MNSAKKPIMPLETAVILKMETEMIAKILPSNFSGMFFCIIDTLEIIKKVYEDFNYILDPHSAIGYGAAQKALDNKIISENTPIVSLACAHPAKFPEIINKSINIMPKNPFNLETIMNSKEYFEIMEPSMNDIQNFIKSNMRN